MRVVAIYATRFPLGRFIGTWTDAGDTNGGCGGVGSAMRDRDQDFADADVLGASFGSAA